MQRCLLLSLVAFLIGFSVAEVRGAKREAAINSRLTHYEKTIESYQSKRVERKPKTTKRVIASAYSPRKRETDGDPHINAAMKKARPGTIAVSRDLFWDGWTFGKKVYIEGMGVYVISDLMHKRKRKQIDIFMGSTKEAYKFGRKELKIALLH